jgi:hypothetical protein
MCAMFEEVLERLFQMRYGIEFLNHDCSIFPYLEYGNRCVLHSCQTFFASYRRNDSAVDTVVSDEKYRVVRMNGQKAFDKSFGSFANRFDGFGVSGKHIVGNGFSRQTEFFFGFSLPVSERRFAKFLRK